MSDKEFKDFLLHCRNELQTKQQELIDGRMGIPYQYDLETQTFVLGSQIMCCIAVGSYCPSRGTWLWAWANDSFSEKVRESSSSLTQLTKVTGFRVFEQDGIHANRQDAEDFTAMAVHFLGGIGFWRNAGEDLDLYLCLRRQPSNSEGK